MRRPSSRDWWTWASRFQRPMAADHGRGCRRYRTCLPARACDRLAIAFGFAWAVLRWMPLPARVWLPARRRVVHGGGAVRPRTDLPDPSRCRFTKHVRNAGSAGQRRSWWWVFLLMLPAPALMPRWKPERDEAAEALKARFARSRTCRIVPRSGATHDAAPVVDGGGRHRTGHAGFGN